MKEKIRGFLGKFFEGRLTQVETVQFFLIFGTGGAHSETYFVSGSSFGGLSYQSRSGSEGSMADRKDR